jgi:hypothetical protein
MADIGMLLKMLQGEKTPTGLVDDLSASQDAMKKLTEVINLKKKGFGGKGVDTGPMMQYMPNVISSFLAKMEGLPEQQQGDRAGLDAALKWFSNPVRKGVTGAAAGDKELSKYIYPMLPGMGDNEPDFYSKILQAAKALSSQRGSMINTLQSTDYKAPQFNEDEYVNQIKQMLYGK